MIIKLSPAYLVAFLFFLTSAFYMYLFTVTFRTNSNSKARNDYLSAGVSLATGSFFYGLMTITVDETLSRVLWAAGFITGCLFFSRWLLFSSNLVSARRKNIRRKDVRLVINTASVATVILCFVCVFSNKAVFTLTDYGMQFSYQHSLLFMLVTAVLTITIAALLFMHIRWWRDSELKRDRKQALLFIILTLIIAPFAFAADYILPAFTNLTAPPLAAIGFLPVSLPLFISMKKYKTLSITVPNASGYVFNTVTIPTLVLDHKNRIQLENHAAVEFLGSSVVGKNMAEIITINENAPDQAFFDNDFVSGKVLAETPAGVRICDMLLAIENDKYNDPLCKVALLRDITENQHKDDMLQVALEQANAASKAKSDFLSNMSHEIRTPMNAIIGMTAIGKLSKTIEKKDDSLNKIGGASKHLLGVINDILDMSKIEANKLELSPVSFNFEKMLQRVTDVINFRVSERKQRFDVSIGSEIPRVLVGDDQRLSQVVTNLLSNAVKFTPEHGTIHLDAQLAAEAGHGQQGDSILGGGGDGGSGGNGNGSGSGGSDEYCMVQISVEDSGIGISDEQKSRLFRSFEQAESTTSRKFGGTGLGLALSKRIVELMGGEIWVESEPGKGSKFIFTVRLKRSNEECIEDHVDEPGKKPGHSDDFTGYSILLAEDVEINREIVLALLGPTRLSIECAEDGVQALDMFTASPEKYDMILMDIQMPEMDGYEATRKIRALEIPKANTIPIIAMTANVFREDIEKCLEVGMNGHVGKPIDIDEVIRQLQKHLHIGKEGGDAGENVLPGVYVY